MAAARQADLAAAQTTAGRRVAAARGQLTGALKDGNADRIAAASARVETARAECDRVSDDVIAGMHQLVDAGHARLDAMVDQIDHTWTAQAADTDALRPARPRRPTGPAAGDRRPR